MDAARQVALNWAFLMDTLDMTFDELYPMFKALCESLPDDKMAEIMATAEALSDDDDDNRSAVAMMSAILSSGRLSHHALNMG